MTSDAIVSFAFLFSRFSDFIDNKDGRRNQKTIFQISFYFILRRTPTVYIDAPSREIFHVNIYDLQKKIRSFVDHRLSHSFVIDF